MKRMSRAKSVVFGATLLGAMGFISSAVQAQSLYEPYYYSNREQYQTMANTDIQPQHAPTSDVSGQVNYVPDSRLDPQTNKRLAQGEYPPVPTNIKPLPVAPPPSMPLTTLNGVDVGLQGSAYKYSEPGLDRDQGGKLGFTAAITQTFGYQNQYFGTADIRYGLGNTDYSGSGKAENQVDDLWDIRGVVGRDFLWREVVDASPYLGFGYRGLYNDARGLSTTGASGYRRYSEYFYMPIGLTSRLRFDGDSRITGNIEYDYFLHGQQTTDLSDFGPYPSIANQQNSGFGIRGSAMYEFGNWSVGPFFNLWHISNSEVKLVNDPSGGLGCGSSVCQLYEPNNITTEFGAQIKYHFDPFY